MRWKVSFSILITSFCLFANSEREGFAQSQQLAMYVPESANAIVLIDVKQAFASPFAKARKWEMGARPAQRAGMVDLPQGTEFVLMGSEMDFEFMQPKWEMAAAYLKELPAFSEIAERSGGREDRIAGSPAVERPNDSFVVRLGAKTIGVMAPGERQQVNRWIRKARIRKDIALAPYLEEALAEANKQGNHIVMALDMEGLLSPREVESRLARKQDLLGDSAGLKALAEVIATLRGIRLEVQLESPPRGSLTVHFDKAVDPIAEVAKPLLMNVLSESGLVVSDFKQWEAVASNKKVTLEGEVSDSGLLRMLSVLSSSVGPMAKPVVTSGSSEAVAQTSERYFQTIIGYLNDLFFGEARPESLYQAKVWVQRYARAIENLDVQDVDQELLDYAQQVVDSLYEVHSIVDRAESRGDDREANMYGAGRMRYGRYGVYGFYEKPTFTRDRMLIKADEGLRALESTDVIVEQLQVLSAETREVMTERYKRKF